MGHGRPDKYMLSCMASACGITGDAEKAMHCLRSSRSIRWKWCSSAKRNSNHILQILRISDFITHSHTLEHYEGRLYYSNIVTEMYFRKLRKLNCASRSNTGTPPAAAFAGVMRACARSRHWNREAFTYFDRMLANGHDATVQTMTILIDACSLTGDVESAKKLFQAIDAHPEMEMNEYVYSAMLNTYARGMRPRKETKDHWAPPVLRNPRQGLPDGVKLGYQTDGTWCSSVGANSLLSVFTRMSTPECITHLYQKKITRTRRSNTGTAR